MELSFSLYQPQKPTLLHQSLTSISITRKIPFNRNASKFPCRCSCSLSSSEVITNFVPQIDGRRELIGSFIAAAAGLCVSNVAGAVSTSRRALKGAKVPETEYKTLPNGLKYYDLKVGKGAEAVKGSRVAVRFVT